MRISDHLVVQFIDSLDPDNDQLVLVDDSSGTEVTIPFARDVGGWIREHAHRNHFGQYEVDAITLSEADWAVFCFAIGYFWSAKNH